MTAQIVQNDGSGPVVGTLVQTSDKVNVPVTFSNFDNTGVLGWRWEILDAPAPSPTLNPLPPAVFTPTTIITPDVVGHSIRVRLTTYADAGLTIVDDVDEVILGVRFSPPFDWLIPAAGETLQVDTIRGWATEVNRQLRDVQAFLEGQRDSKESVRLATDAPLVDTYVRTGNVILMDTAQALEDIDGVTPQLNDRILLKNGVSNLDNGIYRVTVEGDGGTQAELTRTEDFNSDEEVTSGALIPVGPEGTNNQNKIFMVSSPDPIQVNFDPITFAESSGGTAFDPDAIHDNVAAEISAVAAKATPVGADLALIEDSEDSDNKKRITLSQILNLGGLLAFDDTLKVANFNAVSNTIYRVDDGSTVTATMPSTPSAGDVIVFFRDTGNQAALFTVNGNGNNVRAAEVAAATWAFRGGGQAMLFRFSANASEWQLHGDTLAGLFALLGTSSGSPANNRYLRPSANLSGKVEWDTVNINTIPSRSESAAYQDNSADSGQLGHIIFNSTSSVTDASTGTQNDWIPGGSLTNFRRFRLIRVNPGSPLTVNGMRHDATLFDGDPVKIFKNESSSVYAVFNNESASAAAADRSFRTPGSQPFILPPGGAALFYYFRSLSRWFIVGSISSDFVAGTGVQHWYVSPSLGDDANDGRSTGTPLETLIEFESRLPDVQTVPIACHMRGEDYPAARFRKRLMQRGVYFIADEAWDPTVETIIVASDAAEGGTTNAAIEATGSPVAPGDTIEFLDGLAAGQRRTVVDYTGTTITPAIPFDATNAPVAADNFKITRWNTCRIVFSTPSIQAETFFEGGGTRDGDCSDADEAPFTGYAFKGVGLRCSNLFARPVFKDGTYAFFGMEKTWGGAVSGNDGWLLYFTNASVSFGSAAGLGAPRFIEDAPFSESDEQNWFGWGAQQDASDRAAFCAPTDDTRLTLIGRWSYLDLGGPGRRISYVRAVGRFEPPAGLTKVPLFLNGPVEMHFGRFGTQSFGVIDGAVALISVDSSVVSMSSQSFLRLENIDLAADSGNILDIESVALVSIADTVTGAATTGKAVNAKFGAYILLEGGAPNLGRAGPDTDWDVGNGTPRDKTWFSSVGASMNQAFDRTTIVRRS